MRKRLLDQEKEIVEFYKKKPITIKEMSEVFDLSEPSIIKILNKFRVKRYSKVQLFSPELKEDYFENIDTEEKAYFLGLIITDGCLYDKGSKQKLVSLTLQEQDSYILDQFVKEINSNKKITSDGRGCKEISILSNRLFDSLKKYGLKPNKSLKTIFPKNLSKEMYPHLIRGILDGDGSFSFYKRKERKSHTKAIRLCQGNLEFLADIISFLKKEIGAKEIKIFKEKDNLWSFAYRDNESIKKIYSYIYKDATIYIKRKKETCDLIIKEIENYHGNTEINNA